MHYKIVRFNSVILIVLFIDFIKLSSLTICPCEKNKGAYTKEKLYVFGGGGDPHFFPHVNVLLSFAVQ